MERQPRVLGKRDFLTFIAQARHRELVRRNVESLVDPIEMQAIDHLMRTA